LGLLGPAIALAAAGLTEGLVYGLVGGDVGRELPRVLAGALVQLPAVLVLSGVAMALFGLLPRLASVSWATLAVFALLVLLSPLLRLNQWLLDVAPLSHIPKVPGADVSATPWRGCWRLPRRWSPPAWPGSAAAAWSAPPDRLPPRRASRAAAAAKPAEQGLPGWSWCWQAHDP
jgi:hypothetical protein